MKQYTIEAIEEVFYQKTIKANNEEEAKAIFLQTISDEDMVDGRGFEITDIKEE